MFGVLYEEEVKQFEYADGWTIFETGRAGVGKDGIKPVRTFRAGITDLAARIPSVAALSGKSVAVIGLGAIGSQVAYELARNGVSEIHAIDFDFVEPATVRRWVSGVPSFGLLKPLALTELVAREYPSTTVVPHSIKIGAFYDPPHRHYDELKAVLDSVDAVVDLSIEVGVNYLVSQMCWAVEKPYILANASPGAWGGRVIQFDRRCDHACWVCYNADLDLRPGHYRVSSDPQGELQPPGCAARTFTGTSFDLGEIAMETVRVVCGCIDHTGAYPKARWQVSLCSLFDGNPPRTPPKWSDADIARRQDCQCVAQ